jgi:apolipoprotein N-acyltransferase
MNGISANDDQRRPPSVKALAAAGVTLQWLSQPPFAFWPLAFVALVPWVMLVARAECIKHSGGKTIWLAGLLYWLLSLQGLRHAHPAIYLGWFTLAAYLSVYGVLFVSLSRQLIRKGIPLWLTVPAIWIGLECIRNYFATGISAAMLGHTMADVPVMIQIADLFGSYGIGFVIVTINVAIYEVVALRFRKEAETRKPMKLVPPVLFALALLSATIGYGYFRLAEIRDVKPLATFALLQRSEVVEYVSNPKRDSDMFYNYARQGVTALESSDQTVNAVVWPESMFSGGMFWIDDDENSVPPPQFETDLQDFRAGVAYQCSEFNARSIDLQNAFAQSNGDTKPNLIGGVGVIRYTKDPQMFSGMVNVEPDGIVSDWYGKTHRVMFGEYIPILSSIPVIRDYIPLQLRLSKGPGPQRFAVGKTIVSPNICIETAVERVTVNHLSQLKKDGGLPDVILTVTNDGWFDDSSVINHHLRCAQLVAVGCRRPILSAANNGPTAWINSSGAIVQRLATGSEGAIIATPESDERESLYVTIGDWPARLLALVCIGLMVTMGYEKYSSRSHSLRPSS